jgi:hypothetical protein
VYAPLLNQFPAQQVGISHLILWIEVLNAPFEHLDLENQDVKSRILRGLSNKIWQFQNSFI